VEILNRLVVVSDQSGVAEVRRTAMSAAKSVGFDEEEAGRVGLVATELGTNLVKHAGGGQFLVRTFDDQQDAVVECLALDKGPGIADLSIAQRDGYSTAGSPGTGLGAIRRSSHAFDIYSQPSVGTAVLARLRRGRILREPSSAQHWIGVVELAIAGELVCGDAWSVKRTSRGFTAIVADGLGHGDGAAEASRLAIDQFEARTWSSPRDAIESMHLSLKPTRGAAIGICDVDVTAGTVSFAGIGNIGAAIVTVDGAKQMVSLHGTVGHAAKRVQQFAYPLPTDALIAMCSDGLLTKWSLIGYPGLLERDPALIAGILYRDFNRGRDDVTVLCVKGALA
jgi:anti-sigma regulatory factor (Ser/Thr protein kinase)